MVYNVCVFEIGSLLWVCRWQFGGAARGGGRGDLWPGSLDSPEHSLLEVDKVSPVAKDPAPHYTLLLLKNDSGSIQSVLYISSGPYGVPYVTGFLKHFCSFDIPLIQN